MKPFICILISIFAIAAKASAQSNSAPVRLALVSAGADATTAADLLTVELSKKGDLQLLERAQIEKVYREQGLSAANRDYLKLGQILGADGLLLLEVVKEGTNQFLLTRLVVVKPGVVIDAVHVTWPIEDAPQWATGMARHLGPLLPKLGVLVKDAIPISVVSLHSSVQSSEEQETERQLTLLTIERLTRQRELFVLERRQMESLAAEKELNLDESVFWNGSYLLDGVVDRDGYSKDTVTINARLTPPKGGAPVSVDVSGSRTNLPAVINQLAERIRDNLKLRSGTTSWNTTDEADQYFEEAKWAYKWKLFTEAQTATESAWALGMRTKEVAALRIRAYSDGVPQGYGYISAGDIAFPRFPEAAEIKHAIRTAELFCQDAGLAFTNTASPDEEWFDLGLQRALCKASLTLGGFHHDAELRVGNEAQLAELRSLARQIVEVLETNVPASRLAQGFYRDSHKVGRREEATLARYQWGVGGL